jgi:PAS domain S-box-containing protein
LTGSGAPGAAGLIDLTRENMQTSNDSARTRDELLAEIAELRSRLAEPEETVGAIRRGEVDAFVLLEPGGEQLYTLGTADLLRQLHVVTDSLPALVAYVDRDLRYRFNSRRYEAWFGLPPHRIAGRRVVEVLGEPAFAIFREAMEEALAGRQVACERWAPMPNLGERCLRASFLPHVPAGEVLGFVAFVEDITERKRAEEALRLLADAGELLAEALGAKETLEIGARLAMPRLADWCVIDLLDPRGEGAGGGKRYVSRAPGVLDGPGDPGGPGVADAPGGPDVAGAPGVLGSPDVPGGLGGARRHPLQALQDAAPVWSEGSVAAAVLRTGEPALLADAPPGAIAAALAGADRADIVAALAPCSLASVPLLARGRNLGVWHLVYAESGRRHRPEDLTVALELARRTAVAIDNARLYHELEAANRAKDHFLATLSHELRTPLTPVLAVASQLETDDLPPRVRDAFGMIRRNVELEARLIDDLLDLTRVARGKLELYSEATDLRQVIRQAIETCGERELAARHLESALVADDHQVWGDPSRLVQVFWNLLNNAVKFTPEGGTIRLRSYVETAAAAPAPPALQAGIAGIPPGGSAGAPAIAGTPGRSLAIEIVDSGIGIEPEELPHIFDAFDQGGAGITRRFGGLGLGLAISRAIVERHDGILTAASAGRDRGTTFTVRLPLRGTAGADELGVAANAANAAIAATADVANTAGVAADAEPGARQGPGSGPAADSGEPRQTPPPAAAARAAAPGTPAAPAAPTVPAMCAAGMAIHILLVEDHADTAGAMAELFAALGARITVAGSIAAALAAAERGGIDLVISDLGLPDGDGRDLMRRLAAAHGLRGIALSGYGKEDDVESSRAAGFALHLTKPVTAETLRAAIEQLGTTGARLQEPAPLA